MHFLVDPPPQKKCMAPTPLFHAVKIQHIYYVAGDMKPLKSFLFGDNILCNMNF